LRKRDGRRSEREWRSANKKKEEITDLKVGHYKARVLGFGRVGFVLLRFGNFDDDFVGLGEAEFVAGDRFDLVRIGLEGFYLVGQIEIFFVEAFDVGLNVLDFKFGAAQGEIAMSSENVVKEKREHAEDQDEASVLRPESCEFSLLRHARSAFKLRVSSQWLREQV
jgi:hypothetical protein